jgi:hypothetical protein
VLAYTAAKMITDDPFLQSLFDSQLIKWGAIAAIVAGVLWLGSRKQTAQ